jgi:hypothetical protein
MPLIILGVVVVIGIVVMFVLSKRSTKADARKLAEQSKRRNES